MKPKQTLKQYFGGDIQKFSEKLPGFIWSKYPKEKHLPSYNYLGPGMRLDIRLKKIIFPSKAKNLLMRSIDWPISMTWFTRNLVIYKTDIELIWI